ncbi:Ornithine carbamoyltransferase, mitochondrial [Wickerhamiella sorbophila]|uniref:ornithine carbamoyltransferase n=1 Tax=Wickerhamiella sorbophila TaxID=45607 RepID=A0A2T0FGK3_9ASCO|nr:Ornithine carbamoyltransferase, mitochondrial [Wickerhamiella sorbophila]PRT54115.1 Ornithine carbamoyltransferase, mitochondrial [Wickerhamiella sorbophila]
MARSFISIADLTATELKTLVANGIKIKKAIRSGNYKNPAPLQGQTVSLIFSKRSTRTRISTEGAVAYLGGQPMFLGKDDIQLGVNESLYDTTRVVSSMTSAIVARVGPHSDIQALAKDSRVPVINALCEKFHPMQAVADMIAIQEAFGAFSGLKVAWVGDANNVLHDFALASVKLGMDISIATPSGRPVSDEIKKLIANNAESGASAHYTSDPLEAVKDANVIVTDTWISMGQEEETQQKLKEFAGYQVTMDMAAKGGAAANWKFMHCLPRHKEEVDDEVFYSDRSVVFEEAENRLYSAIAVLDAFVVNKGVVE